jgi:hypothetical protein
MHDLMEQNQTDTEQVITESSELIERYKQSTNQLKICNDKLNKAGDIVKRYQGLLDEQDALYEQCFSDLKESLIAD